MKAMVLEQYNDVSPFISRDVEKPTPKAGHLVVQVRASSVNPIDVKLGKAALPFSRPLPTILHGDFAGVVTEVGAGVNSFHKGDEVYGCAGGVRGTDGGALADYMLVDADLVSHKPKSLSFEQAAVLPLVALTAWEALVDKLSVKPGQRLLVHGATGGVGHVAIQLGVWLGAKVATTAGTERQLQLAKELGAHEVINYQTELPKDYVARLTDGQGFDAIFDTVGGPNLQNSFQAIKPNGGIACSATGGNHDLSPLYLQGGSLHSVLMLLPMLTGRNRAHHGSILRKIAEIVDSGRMRPLIDERQFPFSQVAEAHRYLESGKALGKISLTHR